jgi:L-aspartate oxidase
MRVGVLTKGELDQSTTRWAQGGVAAVLAGDEDSTDLHLADTLRAGADLCDEAAVRVLVDEGPGRVHELIALGAVFDRGPAGDLSRAREGGHSMPRVLHAGGAATGAEVERALVAAVERSAAAVLEHWFALDLIVEHGRCVGVVALDPSGQLQRVEASDVLLACGGAGQLYAVTTNPAEATGDGIAMAIRAGVPVADSEFVQFHPTALHHPAMPRPLVSEALRGHGALLRGEGGRRFVDELAPRDVVSRAMAQEMVENAIENVWLDCTGLEAFGQRFPTIHASLAEIGLDPGRDWLPVAPAAHHLSGGVLTDLDGATALPGLWAAGETACTGVHGANRLASNSLLEGMVFGSRVVDALSGGRPSPSDRGRTGVLGEHPTVPLRPLPGCRCASPLAGEWFGQSSSGPPADPATRKAQLQAAMTAQAGVVRDAVSLKAAERAVDEVAATFSSVAVLGPAAPAVTGGAVAEAELVNLVTLARALVESATRREESRGAHTRSDFPERSGDLLARFVHGGRR